MDDLSLILSVSEIGCHIEDLCINHIFYANDLYLMAPCAIALQELISLCYESRVKIDLNLMRQSLIVLHSLLNSIAIIALHSPFAYLIYRLYKVSYLNI